MNVNLQSEVLQCVSWLSDWVLAFTSSHRGNLLICFNCPVSHSFLFNFINIHRIWALDPCCSTLNDLQKPLSQLAAVFYIPLLEPHKPSPSIISNSTTAAGCKSGTTTEIWRRSQSQLSVAAATVSFNCDSEPKIADKLPKLKFNGLKMQSM